MSNRNGTITQLATLIVLVLVGLFTWWSDDKASKKLDTIHVEVNSRLTEALDEVSDLKLHLSLALEKIEYLEQQYRQTTGEKPETKE